MKPLSSIQQALTWLCVLPFDGTTSKLEKLACYSFLSATILIIMSGLAAAIAFIYEYKSTDLSGYSCAVVQIVTFINLTYTIIVGFYIRHKLPGIFEKLAAIYDANTNKDSFQFLVQTNEKCEWLWRIFIKNSICVVIIGGIVPLASVIFCWITNGEFDAKLVFHPNKVVLPWNQSTILGYCGEIVFVLAAGPFLIYIGCTCLLFVSICLHHQAFYKMFRHSLKKLELPDKKRNNKELLCSLIRFHITVKDWFSETAEAFKFLILVELSCNTVMLVCFVFDLDTQIQNADFNFILTIEGVSIYICNMFIYCYSGKMATESFKKMTDCVYESVWPDLPIPLQKYFILMIQNTQKTVFYHGFGMLKLNLETFRKLLRAAYTYYMMLRTLAHK